MFRYVVALLSLAFVTIAKAAIVVGNPHGNVTLIEVFDYQCIHCQHEYNVMQQLEQNNPNLKVRLMPVAILNKNSIYEAAAAEVAAQNTNAFSQFDQAAMGGHPLNHEQVTNLLSQLHLDGPKYLREMHSPNIEKQLNEGLKFLQLEQSGTPLFVVYPTNNAHYSKVLAGEQDYQTLEGVINHVT